MNKIVAGMLAVAATGFISAPAHAQFYNNVQYSPYPFGVNGTQARLQAKINAGIRNGSLTQGEAASLQAKFNNIQALEARMRANGLSPRERARLSERLSRLSFDINRQMTDFQRRHVGWRGGRHHW